MKKILVAMSLLWVTLLFCVSMKAQESEFEELFDYKTGKNINYLNTDEKVTIPKNYTTKERELRGVWVSTVFNIDMPKMISIEHYKKEFIKILDTMELYNMNTMFFQLRPANDAFYVSKLNPFSQFLFGHGKNPGFDPLEYMLEETKKRGFEFHAWLNAFRVSPSGLLAEGTKASDLSKEKLLEEKNKYLNNLSDQSFAKQNKDLVMMGEKDTKLILNPGDLRVQKFLIETIKELIENYDIDGFHFDDYFYLSNSSGNNQTENYAFARKEYDSNPQNDLNDLRIYDDYKQNSQKYDMVNNLTLGDFRRESINNLMKNISLLVKNHNSTNRKNVLFGSKPAAVWRSNSANCTSGEQRGSFDGSNTHCYAYSSYYDLFADSKKWVTEGYVDYIAPQIYFSFQSKEVPYADIVKWWAEVVETTNIKLNGTKKINMYVAHGIYKYDENPEQFNNPKEMIHQLKYNTKYEAIKGSAVFAYNDLYLTKHDAHKEGLVLFKELWNKKVLPLQTKQENNFNAKIDAVKMVNYKNYLKVQFSGLDNSYKYCVFKGEKGKEELVDIIGNTEKIDLKIPNYNENERYKIIILSKNNVLSNESFLLEKKNIKENTAPFIENLNFSTDNTIFHYDTKIKFYFDKPQDSEYDNLSVKVYLLQNGKDSNRKTDLTSQLKMKDNQYVLNWTTYFVDILDGYILVEVTDGDLSSQYYSKQFVVKDLTNIPTNPTTTTIPQETTTTTTISDTKNSCKKQNNASPLSLIFMSTSLLIGTFVLIKRKEK